MTASPKFAPVDEDTADLLSLVADTQTPLGQHHYTRFLAACEADAAANDGLVSVNRVRAALTVDGELQIEARAFSGMWSAATGPGRPMVKVDGWITCQGSTSGNDGRPYPARKWVGDRTETDPSLAAETRPAPPTIRTHVGEHTDADIDAVTLDIQAELRQASGASA